MAPDYDQKPENPSAELQVASISVYEQGALDAYGAVLEAISDGLSLDDLRINCERAISYLEREREEIPQKGDDKQAQIDQSKRHG